jgi:Glycosyl transferase family group 2
VSNKVEDKLADVQRHGAWTKELEMEAYERCLKEVLHDLNGRAWADGNVRMGDYILLIDSDTRVPADCLLDAASEMEQSPEVAIIQFSSGVMRVTKSYFEVSISSDEDYLTNRYSPVSLSLQTLSIPPFDSLLPVETYALSLVTMLSFDGPPFNKSRTKTKMDMKSSGPSRTCLRISIWHYVFNAMDTYSV